MKELGAKVYQSVREADDEIVTYAHEHEEVFGILSQDSDFIIYNTKQYYSLSHLDFDNLQTIHYDRCVLAHTYLNLEVKQLPLFACLIGNHFVPFDRLRKFHRRLVGRGPVYVAAIAPNLSNVIRVQNWSGNPNNENELALISKFVFGNYDWIDVIRDGLNSYFLGSTSPLQMCLKMHPNFEKEMYRRHVSCSTSPYVFNLLCKLEYGCSEVLEDITAKPSALIYREIRQRCYSLLFNLQSGCSPILPNGEPIVIKEWCGYHGNYMENPEFIKPLPLKNFVKSVDHLPSIDQVWFSSSENVKLHIFWSILQLPMKFDILLKIPKHLLVFSCIINYLIGGSAPGPHLKASEVAVFVAQAVWAKSVSELEKLQVPWVDSIAINLSTLFMRGVAAVLMAFGICGDPFPITYVMPWHFYDGKLFHFLYTSTKNRFTVYDLCRNKSDTTEEFYNLLAYVTNNTIYDIRKFDWESIITDFKYHRT